MKPLFLSMTAFGSYADTTEIDFTLLDKGLYLVAGDTGAGKTTIFDAIVFALYGSASGDERRYEMMHCDYVPLTTDTRVVLRFAQDDKEYEVTRTLHLQMKQGTKEVGKVVQKAVLKEPDRLPIENPTAVTGRITKILGLNKDQFCRVIMLAQGEFDRFLREKSDQKNMILGKLFDSSPYLRLQKLLSGARGELKARRERRREALTRYLKESFLMPEDWEPERLLADDSVLSSRLAELAADEESAFTAQKEEKAKAQQALDELNRRRGAAQEINQQLDARETLRAQLAALEEQAPLFAAKEESIQRAERAFRRVQPAREQRDAAQKRLMTLRGEIAALQEAMVQLEEEHRRAAGVVASDEEKKTRREQLLADVQRLEEILPRYDEFQREEQAARTAARLAQEAGEKRDALLRQMETVKQELERITAQKAQLEDAPAQAERRKTQAQQAQKALDAVQGPEGLSDQLTLLLRDEKEIAVREGTLQRLSQTALDALEEYNRLYRAFLEAQAGILAGELHRELEENGAALCPVCGTKFCRREHMPKLPPVSGEIPDKVKVEAARTRMNQAEKARADLQESISADRASLAQRRLSFLRDGESMLPESGGRWEVLSGPGWLADQGKRLQQEKDRADRAAADAVQALALKQRLAQDEEKKRSLLEELSRQQEEESRLSQEQEGVARTHRALAGQIRTSLPFETREIAVDQKLQREKLAERISRELAAHEESLRRVKERMDQARGSLAEKQERNLPACEQEDADAKKALEQALTENGFSGEDEALRALIILGERGEAGLQELRAQLEQYHREKHSASQRLEDLERQTRGKERQDLAALEEEIGLAGERLRQLDQEISQQEKRLENHRKALELAGQLLRSNRESEAAWRRLDRLGTLAEGPSGEGGKLSFERYVMGAAFREILEMANRRLTVMSGGRYELMQDVNARRANSAAGLEIQVRDAATGRQRDAGSLSGGESFLASLALALGLSDVVQNHAGGKALDALFIDEGFGSLDGAALDKAIEVLGQLLQGNRLVGVISHVDKLESGIQRKILVTSGPKGSRAKIIL